MNRRRVVLTAIIVIAVIAAFLVFDNRHKLNPTPPLLEMESARKALAKSRNNKSNIYAASLYQKAERLYDSAMTCWERENEKLPFNRDYTLVKRLAAEVEYLTTQSGEESKRSLAGMKVFLGQKTDSLQRAWKDFRGIFSLLPLPSDVRKTYMKGMLLLTESQKAYQDKMFLLASEKLALAEKDLSTAYVYSKNMLADYFAGFHEWKNQVKNTIDGSKRTGSYAIVIDKFSRECLLYHKGNLKDSFSIELGPNWIGDKQHRGDKTTPEGYYKVVSKKEGRKTKYYKAFLLDYPNSDDKERFRNSKAAGKLGRSADPGGNIEIHGGGGKGTDWTDGCIALKNTEMDVLYKYCSVGTPVTIVGSLKPLEDYIR